MFLSILFSWNIITIAPQRQVKPHYVLSKAMRILQVKIQLLGTDLRIKSNHACPWRPTGTPSPPWKSCPKPQVCPCFFQASKARGIGVCIFWSPCKHMMKMTGIGMANDNGESFHLSIDQRNLPWELLWASIVTISSPPEKQVGREFALACICSAPYRPSG